MWELIVDCLFARPKIGRVYGWIDCFDATSGVILLFVTLSEIPIFEC